MCSSPNKCVWVAFSISLIIPNALCAGPSSLLSNFFGGGEAEVTINFDEEMCGREYPLHISVNNKTNADITEVELLAYVHEPNSSRAECAEHYHLQDRVIKSGEIYNSCWSILQTRGITTRGIKFSDEMIDNSLSMDIIPFSMTYGPEAADARVDLARMHLSHIEKTTSVKPKQLLGCRGVSASSPWAGKIISFKDFSGFGPN